MNKLRGSLLRLCAIIACVTLVALFILAVYEYLNERSFDADASMDADATISSLQRPSNPSSPVKIGIIGDSWVEGKGLEVSVQKLLAAKGINAVVVPMGHAGANSRQLYRDYLSGQLLQENDFDYLVIVAGVNDTASYIGKDFYAHHMLGIIKAAQARGVKTLYIEVPDYGIESLPFTGVPWGEVLSWGKHLLFRYLHDGGKVNVIADYRKELSAGLAKLPEPVPVIEFDPKIWHYNLKNKLYANPLHLNTEGCDELSSLIADALIASHKKSVP